MTLADNRIDELKRGIIIEQQENSRRPLKAIVAAAPFIRLSSKTNASN
jgi:hypothetical protein